MVGVVAYCRELWFLVCNILDDAGIWETLGRYRTRSIELRVSSSSLQAFVMRFSVPV